MSGINVSGSSAWHTSRPDYLRVGSDLLGMKTPKTEKIANEIISFRDRDKIDASQKASFALARDAVNREMTVNAGQGSLTIAAGRGAVGGA